MRPRLWVALGAMALGHGCLGSAAEVEAEGSDRGVTLVVQVDPARLCDRVDIVAFYVATRRIGCGEDRNCAAPTGIELIGTRVSCPAVEATTRLAITVSEPGRYLVNLVAQDATGAEQRLCLAPSPELAEVAVGVADLEAQARFDLVVLDGPCLT